MHMRAVACRGQKGVLGSLELWTARPGNQTQILLQEQHILLTVEPSLQPLIPFL